MVLCVKKDAGQNGRKGAALAKAADLMEHCIADTNGGVKFEPFQRGEDVIHGHGSEPRWHDCGALGHAVGRRPVAWEPELFHTSPFEQLHDVAGQRNAVVSVTMSEERARVQLGANNAWFITVAAATPGRRITAQPVIRAVELVPQGWLLANREGAKVCCADQDK
jgi:hypothetical protein